MDYWSVLKYESTWTVMYGFKPIRTYDNAKDAWIFMRQCERGSSTNFIEEWLTK